MEKFKKYLKDRGPISRTQQTFLKRNSPLSAIEKVRTRAKEILNKSSVEKKKGDYLQIRLQRAVLQMVRARQILDCQCNSKTFLTQFLKNYTELLGQSSTRRKRLGNYSGSDFVGTIEYVEDLLVLVLDT